MLEKEFTEVYQIMKYMDIEDIKKIPETFIKMIEEKKDSNYSFKYDESKKINDQKLLPDTRIIISLMYLRYLAPKDKKERLYKLLLEDKKKVENNYINTKIIKESIITEEQNKVNDNKELIIVNDNQKWYQRIFNKVKSFFKSFIK